MVNEMKKDNPKICIPSNRTEDRNIQPFSKSGQITTKSAYRVLSTNNIMHSMNSISWKGNNIEKFLSHQEPSYLDENV